MWAQIAKLDIGGTELCVIFIELGVPVPSL